MASKQARFTDKEIATRWGAAYSFGKRKYEDQPEYCAEKMHDLDRFMINALEREPYLSGMIAKLMSSYANRGWTVVAGERVARLCAAMLHNFDDGVGWRIATERRARSYLTRNAGAFVEIERELAPRLRNNRWQLWPATNLYNMDSSLVLWRTWNHDLMPKLPIVGQEPPTAAQLELWKNVNDFPITYDASDPWCRYEFYHIMSTPDDTQDNFRLGRSALYRAFELVKILVAIYDYEDGLLDENFVDGLLLLKGATAEQFKAAMDARRAEQGKNAAARLAILGDPDGLIEARLQALREVPVTFQRYEDRVMLILQAYALNLGHNIDEFMVTDSRQIFGQNQGEINAKERNTAGTGGAGFHLKDQEQIQRILPTSAHFAYDPAAVDELTEIEVRSQKAEMIRQLFLAQRIAPLIFTDTQTAGGSATDEGAGRSASGSIQRSEPLYSRRARGENLGAQEKFIQWLVDEGIFPPNWTEESESVRVDDLLTVKRMRELAMQTPQTRTLIQAVRSGQAKDDRLVRYHWHTDRNGIEYRTETTLADSIAELSRPTVFPTHQVRHRNQRADPPQDAPKGTSLDGMVTMQRELEKIWYELLQAQYAGIMDALDDLDAGDGEEQIVAAVTQRTKALRDLLRGSSQAAMLGFIYQVLNAGMMNAYGQGSAGNPAKAGIDVEKLTPTLQAYAQKRLLSLLNENNEEVGDPSIENPLTGTTLDAESISQMIQIVKQAWAGGWVTERIQSAIDEIILRRSQEIAANEVARHYGYAQWETLKLFEPPKKRWGKTSSANPRIEHIRTVGETVDFAQKFSNGLLWAPGEVHGCRCEIELIWSEAEL